MGEPDVDEDLFADLYDGDDEPAPAPAVAASEPAAPEPVIDSHPEPVIASSNAGLADHNEQPQDGTADQSYQQSMTNQFSDNQHNGGFGAQNGGYAGDSHPDERPIGMKEDGKMFIGGLNWETTDQSLKDYFSQFGEVTECTVMRDGATGRSRGFGFLTFRDPKIVNTVMVKEHMLDGKLIDPKRAIPREEQDRTAKIFVGGVSQEATEADFKSFFDQFGRVLDATLMMDKETGRPRGFGFVTFDSDAAVERTLEGPLAILNKPIEVKRAQPRGKMGEEENNNSRGFGRGAGRGGGQQFGGNQGGGFGGANAGANGGGDNAGGALTPAMMAAYWQRMQQYFSMMSGGMGGNMNMMGGMQNPMMQQMMAAQQQGGGGNMNPAMMMQQQQQQQQQQMNQMGGFQGGDGDSPMNGGQGNVPGGPRPGYNPSEQMAFERQKYERQQMARMQQQNFSNQNTWDGMYDDVPAPAGMQGSGGGGSAGRGGFRGGRGGGGGSKQQQQQQGPSNAPANAPTGPKNPGNNRGNYRGGGRGGNRGYHPYARGGG